MPRRFLIMFAAAAVGGVFAAGLFLPGPTGGVLLLVTDVALIALARVTWARLRPQARPFRLVVIAVIAALAVIKLVS